MNRAKSLVINVLRWAGKILVVLLLLLVILVFALRLPFVQRIITNKALSFYTEKVQTPASLGGLYLDFPSKLVVRELYLEGQSADTLVYLDRMSVSANVLGLLQNELQISNVSITGITGHISRDPEGVFNFQYIIDAFGNEQQESNTSEPMEFGIDGAGIVNGRFSYSDQYEGLDVTAHIGNLQVDAEEFNLAESLISVDYLLLQDARAYLRLYRPGKPGNTAAQTEQDTPDTPFRIDGNFAELQRVKFRMDDELGGLTLLSEVSGLQVGIDSLDINNQVYLAEQINMERPFVSLEFMGNPADTVVAETDSTSAVIELIAGSREINLNNGTFRLWDHTKNETPGFDPAHMWFDGLSLQTTEVRYENENIYAMISRVTGSDQRNRKSLSEFTGELAYTDSLTFAKDLDVTFENTHIAGDFTVTYASKEDLLNSPDKVGFQLDLQQTTILPADLTYFAPVTFIPETKLSQPLTVSGKARGSLQDININDLSIQWDEQDVVVPSFHARNIQEFPESEVDFSEVDLTITPAVLSIMQADSLRDLIDFPATMHIQSTGHYRKDSIRANVKFTSAEGDFSVDGNGRMDADSIFDVALLLDLNNFQAGKILMQPDLGAVSLRLNTSGRGSDLATLAASVDLDLEQFVYRGYSYSGLQVNGRIEEESFDGTITYADENLDFDFDGLLSFSQEDMRQNFSLDVSRADLQALNIVEEEFRLLGKLEADITIQEKSDVIGSVMLQEFGVNRGGERYDIQELELNATKEGQERHLNLQSNIAAVEVHASFPMLELPDKVSNYISGYLSDSVQMQTTMADSMRFSIELKEPRFLSDVLLPDLEYLDMQPVTGMFGGAEARVDFQVDSIKYGNMVMDDLSLVLRGDSKVLRGHLGLNSFMQGPVKIENFALDAVSTGNAVDLVVDVRDDEDTLRYHLATNIRRSPDNPENFLVHFTPDDLLLNYQRWIMPGENLVTLGPGNIWFQNFSIGKDNQMISLRSEVSEQADSLLILEANSFELSEVASLANDSIPSLSGLLDGNVDLNMGKGFEADLRVDELVIRGFEVGDVHLVSEKSTLDTFSANLAITGKGNEVRFDGTYNTDRSLNAELDIVKLSLEPVEPISSSNLTDVRGDVHGKFVVSGTVDDPLLNGDLFFDDVSFIVDMVQSRFSLVNQSLAVRDNVFRFEDFTLQDKESKTARVNGQITTEDYIEFDLGLTINTDQFTLLDSREEDNDLFYGKVSATSQLDISGSNLQPKVALDISLSKDSRVTYVIPESTISAQVQSDVIVFIDKDEKNAEFLGKTGPRDSLNQRVKGMRLDAVINVPEEAELTIVVDPISGDALTVRGNALLNLGIRPSGDITLTGRYEVKDGQYHMDFYGIVQRDFKIQEGSFILWTGNIYEAILNVTAVYTARARPVQTTNTERIEFEVQLQLAGEILKPEIGFKINVSEGSPAPIEVQSWIAQLNQDPAQLNKQAFGLLIFNAFFDETGSSGNWYDNLAENTARSSVSSLLNAELNKLSDKIEGIELTFDLSSYEDYNSQGQNIGRTQLELGLSKQFFDNRLIVKFAGNFDLEGQSAYRNNVSDFSGDLKVEYLLTEDGRYRLLGFRETNYDDLLQGEIIRTGGGFIFVRDYDTLKELFRKSDKKE